MKGCAIWKGLEALKFELANAHLGGWGGGKWRGESAGRCEQLMERRRRRLRQGDRSKKEKNCAEDSQNSDKAPGALVTVTHLRSYPVSRLVPRLIPVFFTQTKIFGVPMLDETVEVVITQCPNDATW